MTAHAENKVNKGLSINFATINDNRIFNSWCFDHMGVTTS